MPTDGRDSDLARSSNFDKLNECEHRCKECKVVINELLAFLTHKIDTLPETGILQICLSTYTNEEVETARSIVYKLLAPQKKYTARRKEGSEQKSLQDIIKILKEFEPDHLPAFVARNLNKLPPVSFDHVDVTAFLKEMAILKTDVASIKAKSNVVNDMTTSSSDMEILKSEIDTLKHMVMELKVQEHKSKQTQVEANCVAEKGSQRVKPISSLSLAPTMNSSDHLNVPTMVPVMSSSSRSPGRKTKTTADLSHTPLYRDILISTVQTNTAGKHNNEDDTFTLVEKKKRKKFANMSGTGQSSNKLQVAQLSSAVYVSRLNKSTTMDDIRTYISEMGENCVKVELLTQKHETEFISFKITVDKNRLERFLSVNFWPVGVRFRRFREYSARGIKNQNN